VSVKQVGPATRRGPADAGQLPRNVESGTSLPMGRHRTACMLRHAGTPRPPMPAIVLPIVSSPRTEERYEATKNRYFSFGEPSCVGLASARVT
jgi:hypothetical protein